MAATIKKKPIQEETIELHVGNMVVKLKPVPADEVAKANARIQKRVQPIFHKIKTTRRAAAIRASKIILNA